MSNVKFLDEIESVSILKIFELIFCPLLTVVIKIKKNIKNIFICIVNTLT